MFRGRIKCILVALLLVLSVVTWAKGDEEPPAAEPVVDTGVAAPQTKYNEAPMLTERVLAGELPNVDQRLPDDPLVVDIIDEVGKYGGEIRVLWDNPNNGDMYAKMWWDGLFEMPRDGVGIDPGIAAGYEIDDAKMVMTVFLRPGLKWSDGVEFTTDDIRFMYDDIVNYVTKDGVPKTVRNWGSLPQFKEMGVLDDYTIQMGTYNGLGTGPLEMAGWQGSRAQCFQPAHYLKQFHIKYNPDAEKIAAQDGFDTWQDSIKSHYFWGDKVDMNMPDITPWLLKERSQTARSYERNPYFYKVDPEGNQLPYIDRLVVRVVSSEVLQLKITGGETDYAYTTTKMENLDLYKSSESVGDYKTIFVAGLSPSDYTITIGNSYDEPGSPMRELLTNLDFRAALSVAIDRDELNEILANGLGVPSQATVHPAASYYVEGWAERYAQYDPAMASKLLDEVGLAKKDSQGYRIGPDGKTLSLVVEYTNQFYDTFLELIREYWEAVGLKITVKLEDVGLLDERQNAGLVQIGVTGAPNNPNSTERGGFMSVWTWTGGYPKIGQWDRFKGDVVRKHTGVNTLDLDTWAYTETPFDSQWESGEYDGIEHEWPSDWYIDREVLKDKWRSMDMGTPEWVDMGKQVFAMNVEPLNYIGTVGQIPSVLVVKNGLRNAIESGWSTAIGVSHLLNMRWSPQLWWDREDRRQ